jgi:hypothetical protein
MVVKYKKRDKKRTSKQYLYDNTGISVDEAKKYLAEDYVIDTEKRTETNKNPRLTK